MNGKNCRVKGSWSRGLPRGSSYYKANKLTKVTTTPIKPFFSLPRFRQSLINNVNQLQKNLLRSFENYKYIEVIESFKYNNNTPRSIIHLKQSDFNNGSVRIRVPGIYVLTENIIFNPNESNDFLPTQEQISSGLYPTNMMGPWHLGFFAAITVETDNVIIDMNGFTLEQSKKHSFQQRFYANIELANSPFVTKQGPSNFQGGTPYKAANNVLIYNSNQNTTSYLGKSSHHGIHANVANNVVIYNIYFKEYEVAAIALNGTTLGVLSDIYALNTDKNVPILSTYSQARFIRTFLKAIEAAQPNLELNSKKISDVHKTLQDDLDYTFNKFFSTGSIPDKFTDGRVNYFKNQNIGYDANVYGIVLNVRGVVINDFFKERTSEMVGNENIHLDNITINNVCSHPVEIIGVNSNPQTGSAYGGKAQAGPLGDILEITNIQNKDTGKYVGTSLSDAQLIIKKSGMFDPPKTKTLNIQNDIVTWSENGSDIKTIINSEDGSYYYVGGGDSMGHHMKGNIGLFISAGLNLTGKGINISNVDNKGIDVGNSPFRPIVPDPQLKTGSNSAGLLFTGSSNVTFYNTNISNIKTDQGEAKNIKYIGTNSLITVN